MAQVVVVFMTLHLHNRSIKMTPGVCFHHPKRHRLNTKSLTQKQPVTIATLVLRRRGRRILVWFKSKISLRSSNHPNVLIPPLTINYTIPWPLATINHMTTAARLNL